MPQAPRPHEWYELLYQADCGIRGQNNRAPFQSVSKALSARRLPSTCYLCRGEGADKSPVCDGIAAPIILANENLSEHIFQSRNKTVLL